VRLLPKTIRGEFGLFAVSLALPLVGLIGYGLYDRARDEFAATETRTRRLAESSADRAAQYVADLRNTLEAIARRPLVRAMDRARCDPSLADLVDLYPRAGSLIVVDNEGMILCSSRPLPRDRVLRIVDEDLLREMLADPRFRISKPVLGRVSGRWVVSAVQPVFGEGGAAVGTVAMATDLLQWRPFPTSDGLPEGAVITVVTADGTVIARSAEAEKWVGRKAWDERIVQQVLGLKEGVVRAQGPNGVDRIFGFKQVAELPWFVLAGLPEESVFAPARERLAQTGTLLALVVGLVLALSWGLAARISKPIRAIAEALRARAEGNEDVKVPVAGPVEVAGVARELNRLIEASARAERELEGRVRERTAQLEAANQELEGFSYSVSHDLRSPLRAIDGFSRMLTEDYGARLDDEGRRRLAVIRENSRRMGRLIDDLLDFARLGKKPLARSAIDMSSLAGEVYRELRAANPEGAPVFDLGPLPAGWGDPAMLRQVLANLLSNALKYVSKGRAPRIEMKGWADGDHNVYCVKDDGVGFDMAYYDKLFGVFQRLHSEEEFPGTGVGLAIVQRVVTRHGGRVWAESKPDEGSSFYFSLPKAAMNGFAVPPAAPGDRK